MKKIVIVDGHNLLFRMFYGIPSSIQDSRGEEIRGLIGFIGTIKRIQKEIQPYSILVIFDSETSQSHNQLLADDYKSNRPSFHDVLDNENPFFQLPKIYQALEYLKIFHYEVQQYEADDFIASCVSSFSDDQLFIYSTDSDFIQLIKENVSLLQMKGKIPIYTTEADIIDKYHILPKQYVEYKALVGDLADHIQGIRGIGPKTAAHILSYETIFNYIEKGDNCKIQNSLQENLKIINRNIELISLTSSLDTNFVEIEPLLPLDSISVQEIILKIGEK